MAVDAIRTAAFNSGSSLFKDWVSVEIPDNNHLLYSEIDTPHAKYISGIASLYERICDAVANELEIGDFPLVIAGDHASAGGTMGGIKKAIGPQGRLGVVWIDAHADLHSPYTTPSGNVHGMPLAAALGIDNQEHQCNDIQGKTLENWNKMKNTCALNPWVLPEDVVLIGVRDKEGEEEYLIDKHNIKLIGVDEVRNDGMANAVKNTLEQLKDCTDIYISFDVDSLDSELVSDGTGTPVPNGFLEGEALQLVEGLCKDERLRCFELVEVNPTLDSKKNKMAEVALAVLEKVVEVLN